MDRLRVAVAAILALVLAVGPAAGQGARQSFEIATGATAGTYFPMGELIAGIVSHPQGLARCDVRGVCGPAGLIVSARTSDGAAANVRSVNDGLIDSGLAESYVVAEGVAGHGVFRTAGRQSHVRAIANLFPEELQLVASKASGISKVTDLKGKRVSFGNPGSGTDVLAGAVLAAYGVPLRSVHVRRVGYEASARSLQDGTIDAFFFVGGSPSPLVGDVVARGARLVPVDGKGQHRLLRRLPSLSADTIPAGRYARMPAIQTVSCRTLWIVKDTASPDTVYGLVRALFHPANRPTLAAGPAPASRIRLDEAASGLTAPLHPGAERFYRETGKLQAIR